MRAFSEMNHFGTVYFSQYIVVINQFNSERYILIQNQIYMKMPWCPPYQYPCPKDFSTPITLQHVHWLVQQLRVQQINSDQ